MIVMKFGGTSWNRRPPIERVAGIVKARRERRPVVVVSAMGKTTNKLLAIAARRHRRPARRLYRPASRPARLPFARGAPGGAARGTREPGPFSGRALPGTHGAGEGSGGAWRTDARSIDAISAYGERLSSYIVTLGFRHFGLVAEHVDSRDAIVTDNRHTQAAPNFPETNKRLALIVPPLAQRAVVVMGGFIGATEDGVTTTLGRGGSDFTASIVGAAIDAEEIEIWTDVDGMLTADPPFCPAATASRRSRSPKPPSWLTSAPRSCTRPPWRRPWKRTSRC